MGSSRCKYLTVYLGRTDIMIVNEIIYDDSNCKAVCFKNNYTPN